MNKLFFAVSLMILGIATTANASSSRSGGSSGSGGGSSTPLFGAINFGGKASTWIGVGSGTSTVSEPLAQADINNSTYVEGGVEFKTLGPIYTSVAASYVYNMGKLQYDYTSATNVHYTGSDVSFTAGAISIQLALTLRLIDSKSFHLFGSGGIFASTIQMNYTTFGTTIATQGRDFLTNQNDISASGTFAEAGMDFMFGSYGIRVAGRAAKGTSDKIHVLAEQPMKSVDAHGYAALIRAF